MSANNRGILIALLLVVVGIIVCGASVAAMGGRFSGLSTKTYKTDRQEVTEDFRNISVSTDTEELVLMPAEGGRCTVESRLDEDTELLISVKNDTLTLETKESPNRRRFRFFSFSTENPEITLYLPKDTYEAFTAETDTGDVKIPKDFTFDTVSIKGDTADVDCFASAESALEISLTTGDVLIRDIRTGKAGLTTTTGRITAESVSCTGDLTIRVDTGHIRLTDVTCANFLTEGDTGELDLKDVIVSEKLDILRDTGDIHFDGCDAGSISIRTTTGDVTGTLLTEKVFLIETETGDVDVPKTSTGGRCEITTDTGDIKISIA